MEVRLAPPTTPVLLVDDVATSSWHLRATGVTCLAIAWISGTIGGDLKPSLDFGLEQRALTDRQRTVLALASSLA